MDLDLDISSYFLGLSRNRTLLVWELEGIGPYFDQVDRGIIFKCLTLCASTTCLYRSCSGVKERPLEVVES